MPENVPDSMLVLVGEQRMPNIFPLKEYPQIRHVMMIYSPKTESTVSDLKKWLDSNGITSSEEKCDAVNDLKSVALISEKFLKNKSPVLVNVTGGTKIMSLAAFGAAVSHNCPVLYVDTENRRFNWIRQRTGEPFSFKLSINDFLTLHGVVLKSSHELDNRKQEFCRWLGANIDRALPLIKRMKNSPTQKGTNDAEKEFLKRSESAGLMAPRGPNQWIITDRMFYGKNQWLEAITYTALRDAGFDEVKMNVKLDLNDKEIDVVATSGPHLFIASCKSGGTKGEHIDHIESVSKKIGGTFCRKIFVRTTGTRSVGGNHLTGLASHSKTFEVEALYKEDIPDLKLKFERLKL